MIRSYRILCTFTFNYYLCIRLHHFIATLAEGATCPTAALEARGIRMTDQVRRFVFLVVPAEQLEFLETLEAFISLSENAVYHTMMLTAELPKS